MGTRGCVAWKTKNGWKGVYNHFDSYPTGLGAEVWDEIQKVGAAKLVEELKKYGDWREYLSGGICEYCGKKAGQPHSISGIISSVSFNLTRPEYQSKEAFIEYFKGLPAWKGRDAEIAKMAEREFAMIETYKKIGYPDPEAKHHEHGEGAKDQLTNRWSDPLFIEWVYLIDPQKNTLAVLVPIVDPQHKQHQVKESTVRKDGYTDYGTSAYKHVTLKTFDLDGPEPNWEELQQTEIEEVV